MIAESAFIRWKADGNLRSKGQGDLFVLKNYDVKKNNRCLLYFFYFGEAGRGAIVYSSARSTLTLKAGGSRSNHYSIALFSCSNTLCCSLPRCINGYSVG